MKNLNIYIWKKICCYCIITSLVLFIATNIIFNNMDGNFQQRLFTYYLIITFLIYSFLFARKENFKYFIIIWICALILTINLHCFLPDLKWLRFAIQCILALCLYLSYKKSNL